MSIAKSNTTKGLRGSNGNQTYRKLNGQTVVSQRVEDNPSDTPEQRQQRAIMGWTGKLVSFLLLAIRLGFLHRKRRLTAANAFVKQNKGVVTATPTEDPKVFEVKTDYPNLVCAFGNLSIPNASAAYDPETANIMVDVKEPIAGSFMMPDDLICFVLFETKHNYCLCTELGPRKEAKAYTVQVPPGWSGDDLVAYCFVANKKNKRNSPSIYLSLT